MSRRIVTRRNFLHGAAGVSLALPLLHSLGCSNGPGAGERVGRAQGAVGFPKRFIVVYTPNGNIELPDSMDFTGSMLEPLTPFKDKLLLLNGLDMSVHDQGPGEPHQQGMAFLTGRPLNAGNQVGGDGSLAGWASGISVDQQIAKTLSEGKAHRSLHFGVQSTRHVGTDVRTVLSYGGTNDPIANETSPYGMFDLVFSQLGQDPTGVAKLRARRMSVLDTVGNQFEKLVPRVGAEDRLKLEKHLAAVRDVEERLSNPAATVGGHCQVPTVGNPIDLDAVQNFPVIGKLHMDLLVMALACDVTRVATLQWSAATNNRDYPFLQYDEGNGAGLQPMEGDEHTLGHEPDSSVHAWAKLRIIRHWYFEQLAYLLAALDGIQEGEGTMLDNTVVLLGSEITRGNSHSHIDAPFILAGSGGGYFKTGRRLDYGGVPHNNLLVSIMNAMGDDATTFGDPEFCDGPLDGLTA